MKICSAWLFSMFACFGALANVRTYVGSTPAHAVVRDFLQISPTDSIDFIRWKVEIGSGDFKLSAQYGLCNPGTPGFSNEQQVAFKGQLNQSENYYQLKYQGKDISILELNVNVLHFLDQHKRMLSGNGGYSYALNSINPVEVEGFNFQSKQTSIQSPLVFEGRTPCQTLANFLGLNKSAACNKMKWYFLLYTDSLTGKPAHFLMGGIGYKKETMAKGKWEITTNQKGHIIYKLYCDQWNRSLDLLKGEENILFFIDANGRLFVGNEDFSYTLNRREEEYPPVKR